MNRDEILKKSQLENKEEDEREKNIRSKRGIPFIIAFCIAYLFFTIFEFLFLDSEIISHSLGTTLWFCAAIEMWYIAIAIRRRISWYITASAVTLAFITKAISMIIYLIKII